MQPVNIMNCGKRLTEEDFGKEKAYHHFLPDACLVFKP